MVVNRLTVWLGTAFSKFSLQELANFLKGRDKKYFDLHGIEFLS